MLRWTNDDEIKTPMRIAARESRTTHPDARRDIAPVQWQRLAARYGPLPAPPPRAGDACYEPGVAPDEEWGIGIAWTVVVWAVVVIGCVLVGFIALLAIPVIGEWIRR